MIKRQPRRLRLTLFYVRDFYHSLRWKSIEPRFCKLLITHILSFPHRLTSSRSQSPGSNRQAYFKNTENALTVATTNPARPSRHPL